MMLVRDYMTTNFSFLKTHSTFREAVLYFHQSKVGILPVVDEQNQLVGAITRYSVFRALLEDIPLDSDVFTHMIREPVTLFEDEDLVAARQSAVRNQIAHQIVLTRNHEICGILGQAETMRRYETKTESLASSLEFLIAHMPAGVIAVDPDGIILVVNHAALIMCNASEEELIGQPLSRTLPALHQFMLLHDNPDTWLNRVSIHNKKLLLTAKTISHEEHPWGSLLILQDLTDYETIASELEMTKSLKQKLQTVVDAAYDGLILIDQQGKIEIVNHAISELVNCPKEDLIGQEIDRFFPELKLTEALADDFLEENIEAVFMGKSRSLVTKIPIQREKKTVGALGKIIYKNLNKWKTVTRRLENLEKEVSYYRAELSLLGGKHFDLDDILTNNAEMNRLIRLARQSAPGFSSILLLGESGTGKELFARGIHAASNRSGNFIKINCAAIPFELWESEFFGYADGAFTGAKRGGKPGKFELAHQGTLFLDEIGDMPLSMQVKLLRVLQEREFERVGGTQTIRVNVRIIAATNKNLEKMVATEEFREDLYYRLNVIPLTIPPLRDRKEDIPLLATAITKKLSHLMGMGEVSISEHVMPFLAAHHWPGNVRELENVIERTLNCLSGHEIDVHHLPEYLQMKASISSISQPKNPTVPGLIAPPVEASTDLYKKMMLEAEKQAIEAALRAAGDNRTIAAKMMGISRSQLYKKLSKFQSPASLEE